MNNESDVLKGKNESTSVISELCDSIKKGELVVFFGAGISKNSGLPLAQDLETHILKNFGVPIEDINQIIESNFPFEAFIGDILVNTDISPILNIFEKGEPNINHILIARLAKIGLLKVIVTTNFDTLLEKALKYEGLNENEDFMVFYTDEHFAQVNYNDIHNKISIFKIHGSIIEENSIRTILNEVARCRRSEHFQNLLKFIYSKGGHHKVLMLGYSCSDEFDISPIIREIPKDWKKVIVVDHASDFQYLIENIKVKATKNPFKKFPGIRVYVNTNEFVKNLWEFIGEDLGKYEFLIAADLWRDVIETWVEEQKKERSHFRIVGDIFSSISDWKKSGEYYEKVIGEADIDENNNDIFSKIGIAYFGSGDFEKSVIYDEKILKFIQKYRLPDLECKCYLNLGGPYLGLGDFKKAVDYFEKAHDLSLLLRNKDLESGINTNLGIANFLLGNPKTAIRYFQRDIDILQKRGDVGGEALTSIFLGNVYCTLKEFEKALGLYNKAKSIAVPLGSNAIISSYNMGMGIFNINKKSYEKAIDYFKKSLEIDQSVNNRPGISRCCIWLGYAFLGCRKFEESRDWFKKGFDIATNFHFNYEITRCYIGLGKIAFYSNENAIDYFKTALDISERNGYQREISSCREYLHKINGESEKGIAPSSDSLDKIGKFYREDSGNIFPNDIDYEQYDELLQILRRVYREGIIGSYGLKKTLFLISEINPPFLWMNTISAENVDTNCPEYQEMVNIVEEIRNGLLNAPYRSKISQSELQRLFGENFIHQFGDHFSAIYDHIMNSRIKWWDLQYYFYSQKKMAEDEKFSDILVNLFLVMMITYWVYLWNNTQISHNEILDSLINHKDPTDLF